MHTKVPGSCCTDRNCRCGGNVKSQSVNSLSNCSSGAGLVMLVVHFDEALEIGLYRLTMTLPKIRIREAE